MRVFALAVLLSLALPVHLFSQANFFEGKTIKIAVGLPAGDAYDLYARMLANHMGKYISGNPNFIVQNMPGASSMITANYVYGAL